MTTPAELRPYWRRVLDGEEPVFHDGYSGHDWAEEQRDAYWEALRQAADALDKRDEELGTLDADIIVLKAELSRLREELSLTRNAEEVARAEAERYLRVVEAAKGLQQHGSDLHNGTHANILWAALAALDQEVCTGFANNCRCPSCTQRAISDAGMDDQEET